MKREAVEDGDGRAPVAVDPVKEILASRGWSTRAAPASAPKPVTTLITPSGNPASSASSARRRTVPGGVFGGLDDQRVAGRQGRGELGGGQRQRRVPRGDGPDDAERLALGVVEHGDVAGGDLAALDLVGQPGVVVEVLGQGGQLGRASRAGACRCPGFPSGPVPRRAHHQVTEAAQQVPALGLAERSRHSGIFEGLRRPPRRRVDVVLVAAGGLVEDLQRGRVGAGEVFAAMTADQVLR